MSYLYGRYALALMWAGALAGIDVRNNSFMPVVEFIPGITAEKKILREIREIVCASLLPLN